MMNCYFFYIEDKITSHIHATCMFFVYLLHKCTLSQSIVKCKSAIKNLLTQYTIEKYRSFATDPYLYLYYYSCCYCFVKLINTNVFVHVFCAKNKNKIKCLSQLEFIINKEEVQLN